MQFCRIYTFLFFFICQFITYGLLAQTPPVIEGLDKNSGTVSEEITISGKGFGTDPAQVKVLFGAAQADSIVSISDTRLRVLVPAGATSSSIALVRLDSHLTAYSPSLFTLSYDGAGFESSMLESEVTFGTSGTNLYNLCLCDFNLDGLNDIATSDTESKKVTILQNTSPDIHSVSFSPVVVDIDAQTRWVRCGDLNGDGLSDLVFSASNTNLNKDRIYVLRNKSTAGGSIVFEDRVLKSPVASYTIDGNLAARMEIKDLDGDGLPEVVAVDLSAAGGVSVFKNSSTPGGDISFQAAPLLPFASFGIPTTELNSIDIEDLNGDGLPEVLAGKEGENGVYVFTNSSTPGNIAFSSYIMLDAPGLTSNIKVGDLNNDQKPDVVVTNNLYVGIFKNTSTTGGTVSFASHIRFDQTSLAREGLDMADMDGNGKLDIIIGSTANRIVVLLNNSTDKDLDFNTKKVLLVNENNMSAKAGDLNGDGKPDLAYTARNTHKVAVLLNRNCIKPVLEPQAGLGVCDVLPYQLTVTRAVDVSYQWESSADGISFTTVTAAADSTFSFTTEVEAYYRVKASSSHNGFICTEVVSNVVKVVRPEGFVPDKPVILDKNPTTPYCFGENINLNAASINATYFWSGPNGFTSSEQNPVIPDASSAHEGLYVLYVQASAENGGCLSDTATTYIRVSEPEAIAIQSSDMPVFFEGGQATLQVDTFAGSSYSWKKDGELIDGAGSTTLTVSAAGSYTALIQNETGCLRESAPYTIALAEAEIPDQRCMNENIDFYISPETAGGKKVRYRWSFGDGSQAEGAFVSHHYTAAGIYTVAVEILDEQGKAVDRQEKELEILSLPNLQLTASNNAYLCPGEEVTLTANAGFASYSWNTGEETEFITVSEAGTYTLTVTAGSGCIVSRNILVSGALSPDTTITASTNRITLGDTLQLHAPADENATYLWSEGHTLSDSTAASPIARPLITTTYTCLVTNAQGCQRTATFTVTVDRALEVKPQKVFTPNDDGKHDTWYIEKMDLYPGCHMSIFNRQGIKVYETDHYSNENGWDGTIRGRPAPAGVYFYLIDCGKEAGRQTGSVTIMR